MLDTVIGQKFSWQYMQILSRIQRLFPVTETMYESREQSKQQTGNYKFRVFVEVMQLCGVQCIRWYSESLALFVLIQEEKGFLYIFEF